MLNDTSLHDSAHPMSCSLRERLSCGFPDVISTDGRTPDPHTSETDGQTEEKDAEMERLERVGFAGSPEASCPVALVKTNLSIALEFAVHEISPLEEDISLLSLQRWRQS